MTLSSAISIFLLIGGLALLYLCHKCASKRQFFKASACFLCTAILWIAAALNWTYGKRAELADERRELMTELFGEALALERPDKFFTFSGEQSGELELRRFPLSGEAVQSLMKGRRLDEAWIQTPARAEQLVPLNKEAALSKRSGESLKTLQGLVGALKTSGNAFRIDQEDAHPAWTCWVLDLEQLHLYQLKKTP